MPHKGKAVILIVDDNKANLLTLESLLSSDQRTVLCAPDGEQALKLALNQPIDLIILDVHMPGMDGFEVAQFLKSNKKTRDIPIIFASAEKKEHSFMMKGFEEGAVDYLFKPLDPEIAKAKVEVLLKVQLQKHELIEKNSSLLKSELLINNSADILGIIDASSFIIEEINTAFTTLLEYPVSEVIGTNILSFVEEEDHQLLHTWAGRNRENFSFDTRVYTKKGHVKWVQWKCVAKGGKWFINVSDITEIKQLNSYLQEYIQRLEETNESMKELSEMKSRFVSMASHEFRTPLTTILASISLIEKYTLSEEQDKRDKHIKKIVSSVRNLTTILNEFLSIEKLEQGKVTSEVVVFDLKEFLESVIEELRETTRENQAIRYTHTGDTTVSLDKQNLRNIMLNLISNAIKYSTEDVELATAANSEVVELLVADKGIGIPEEEQRKLFERFFRATNTKNVHGTGLGLTIVKQYLDLMDGSIHFTSRQNEGTTFTIRLPLKQPQVVVAAADIKSGSS